MTTSKNMALHRWLGVLLFALLILTGGAWTTVKITIDYLLYRDAASVARGWAQYLADNVPDLEQIARGEQPSEASMTFFRVARNAGQVFRYAIFNLDGYSQLVSDREGIALVSLSEFSPDAARAIKTGELYVDFNEAHGPDVPSYSAAAYVIAQKGRQPVAIVAAYVDLTEQRNVFYRAFLIASLALCALTGVGFGVPAIAWYRRLEEKQRADRHIRFLASHDSLTGLTNRAGFIEALAEALAVLPARGSDIAVHFIDIDHFKAVNDTFGHAGGDFLLKTLAQRLGALTRTDDVVARLGSDEFVVLQSDVTGKAEAEKFARRISAALSAPAFFGDVEIGTTISMGVAISPQDGRTSDRLIKSADLAVYSAKRAGRNCIRFFQPEMDKALKARMEIERSIRDAVVHHKFRLEYQPIFEIKDKRLAGFEALLRLDDPDGKPIPPDTLIQVAEEMGLIDKIGTMALREACTAASAWPASTAVAVNLSAHQFDAGPISEVVADTLAHSGLAAHRLELEITESVLLGRSEPILSELSKLKAMGVSIVMDDFGSGYSSLRYLWQFPFDKIKIDRSFMQGFEEKGRDAEMVVRSIIALGRALRMQVTIEGVETRDQARFIDSAGANLVQGFFFGRPMPAADVSAFLLADFHKAHAAPAAIETEKLKSVG